MSDLNTQPETNSNNHVYPICKDSTNPKKCAEFVEKFDWADSVLENDGDLATHVEAERQSADCCDG